MNPHALAAAGIAAALCAGCPQPPPAATPLPTRERTVGRVQQQLEKADDEAARRREELERASR